VTDRGAAPLRSKIGTGHVLTRVVPATSCAPIAGARVSFWQSNAKSVFTAAGIADRDFPPATVTVSGGSGRYAGATGSGTLEFHTANITGPLSGNRSVTWTGTLNVAGLTFDTTPPQITGATSKVVKTKSAAGARVRYSVSATDATDGAVPVACVPKSGTLFRVGQTTVTCSPTDTSGNAATARFVITAKRVR
jgi:hypothetical protein